DRQRRLVADAGHELRTPLTSLRTNLELLLASEKPGAPTLSAQDRAEIYDDVQAQIAEMTTLIGDLVELARDGAPQAVHQPAERTSAFAGCYRSTEARPVPGSGLGLAIVAQAADRHGGTVYAGRAPEGGALMTIKLPGRPAAVNPSALG